MGTFVSPSCEADFADHVAFHRGELLGYCYRMLGSWPDAEDVLQEVLLAAWRAWDRFEGRSSRRTWLFRIATTRCLNHIRDGGRRVPAEPVPPFVPPPPDGREPATWLTPVPDSLIAGVDDATAEAQIVQRDGIALAFVAVLQGLPPRQAAAIVLCDVLAFRIAEVAHLLDSSEIAVKGLLQRARATLRATADSAGGIEVAADDRDTHGSLASRFAQAYVADDVATLLTLLTDDAWLLMPPAPHGYRGRRSIGAFLEASREWRNGVAPVLIPTRANRRAAFGLYHRRGSHDPALPVGMICLETGSGDIRRVFRFLDATLPSRFGLPTEVAC